MSSILPILIANRDKKCTESRVRNIVSRSFLHIDDFEVPLVWRDPFEARRAVALIDFQSLENVAQQDVFGWQSYVLARVDPATSLLVNTNGIPSLQYGIKDKLKMLFTMKKCGGSSVQFVKAWRPTDASDNHADFFEVCFVKGWDAVLKASSRDWTVGGKGLTVLPLFSCFQENLDAQIAKLSPSINAERSFNTEEDMELCKKNSQLPLQQHSASKDKNQMKEDEKIRTSKTATGRAPKISCDVEMEFPDSLDSKNETSGLFLDQTNGSNTTDIKKSVYAFEGKDSPKTKPGFGLSKKHSFTIECPNLFLGWLLSEVEINSMSEIIVNFDDEKGVLHVQIEDENMSDWCAALGQESYNIQEMPEYVEEFLINKKSSIKLSLSAYQLALNIESLQLVLNKAEGKNDQIMLQTWIASLIEKQRIPNIPKEWLNDESAYKEVKELHSCVKFVSSKSERSLILLALSRDDAKKSLTRASSEIMNLLILFRKSLKMIAKKEEDEFYQEPATVPEFMHPNEKMWADPVEKVDIPKNWNLGFQKKKHDPEDALSKTPDSKRETAETSDSERKTDGRTVESNFIERTSERDITKRTFDVEETDSSTVEPGFGLSNKHPALWKETAPNHFSKEAPHHKEISIHPAALARDILAQVCPSGPWSRPAGFTNEGNKRASMKSSLAQRVIEIECSNLFLGWLLSEAEYDNMSEMIVNFNDEKGVLCVQTEDKNKDAWCAAMAQESVHIQEMPQYQEEFLMEMRSLIKLSQPGCKLALSLSSESPQCIVVETESTKTGQSDGQVTLQFWIASLIEKQIFTDIPKEWLEDESAYGELKKLHSCVKFVSSEREKSLTLLALSWDDAKKSLTRAATDIRNMLILSKISLMTTTKKKEDEFYQEPGTVPKFIHPNEKMWTDPVEKVDTPKKLNPGFHQRKHDSEVALTETLDSKRETDGQTVKSNFNERTSERDMTKRTLHVEEKDSSVAGPKFTETHEKQLAYTYEKIKGFFMQWPLRYIDFLERFLQNEIRAVESKHSPLHIKVENNGLRLQNADNINDVNSDLFSLQSRIKRLQKPFVFPCLEQFLRTEGEGILKGISEQFQCLIFFPGRDSDTSFECVETLQLTDSSYHGIFTGTARIGQRRIHLVQVEPNDITVDMAVGVYASKEVHEATLESGLSDDRLNVYLPEWLSPKGLDCNKLFETQRQRLKEAFVVVFQHADHFRHERVAIFTNGMRETGHANFPVEDFAKAVGEALWHIDFSDTIDVYICDSSSPLVFTAFDYMFTRQRIAFRPSDEKDWEVIRSEVTSSVPDYSSLNKCRQIFVKVAKQDWSSYPNLALDDLLCLPVIIYMDHMSIPFIGGTDQQDLEKFIFAKFPDGLLPGQAEFFAHYRSRKKFLVYCISPWGFNAEKTLGDALTSCLHKGSTYKKINFVSPLGYPDHYVASKVFQCFDTFIESFQNHTQITIWVGNSSKQTAFDGELRKRKPEQMNYFQKLVSNFLPEEKDTEGPSEGTKVTVTQTQKTMTGFISLNDKNNHEASNALFLKLSDLINNNTQQLKLERRKIDISRLEAMVKTNRNISAKLKHQISPKTKKAKKKKKEKPLPGCESIDLTVSALSVDLLGGFIHQLQVNFGSDVISSIRDLGERTTKSESSNVEMETEEISNGEENNVDHEAKIEAVQFGKDTASYDTASFHARENSGTDRDETLAENENTEVMQSKAAEENFDEKRSSSNPGKLERKTTNVSKHPGSMEECHVLKEDLQKNNAPLELVSETAAGENVTDELNSQKQGAGKTKGSNKIGHDNLPTDCSSQHDPKDGCNMDESSMDWENVDPQTMGSQGFMWMWKTEAGLPFLKFCNPKFTKALEGAYLEGKVGVINIDKEDVDLDHLMVESKHYKKQLFRMEVFDPSSVEAVECPSHWCQKGYRTVEIFINNGNYKTISQSLQNGLKSYEARILKVEALENPDLFKKYRCKQKQSSSLKDSVMWHRVTPESKLLACQYGLHYNFMAIPQENRPGDGAICCFFKEPEHCFSAQDTREGASICLVRAVVLVHNDTPYQAISSDAQAYPMHFITVRVKKR